MVKQKDKISVKEIIFWIVGIFFGLFLLIVIAGIIEEGANATGNEFGENYKTIETSDNSWGVKYSDLNINEKDRICKEIESRYNNCLKSYSSSYCNQRFGEFGTKVFSIHKLYEQEERLKIVNYCYP